MRYTILTLFTLMMSIAMIPDTSHAAAPAPQTAMFAGGCFWCMQPAFDRTEGVIATVVGYTGGDASTAHYDAVSHGKSGHVEAIQVTYDPQKVAYTRLLELYWENIDPTDAEGQFADKGSQYHTAIFYADDVQKQAAETSKAAIAKKFAPQPIVVKILPATPFYPAEEYHQKYYQKNGIRYNAYKHGSGRVQRLQELWKKPAAD